MRPLYLLDICIISEQLAARPATPVLEAMVRHESLLAISSVTWHELLYSMERLPAGRKKERIHAWLMEVVAPHVPVIPYDDSAAWIHGSLRARSESEGLPLGFADGQIAATAISRNMILVTRNMADFACIPQLMVENWYECRPDSFG